MSRISPLTVEQLAPPARGALAAAEELMGFTANDALILARNPALMQAVSALVQAVYAPGEVPNPLKRMVGLMTSTAAGCRYCMAHTALSSREFGVDEDKLREIWQFETSEKFTAAERAALRVALHAGQSPSGVTDEMFAELEPHFSVDAQLELVAVIAMFGFLNRLNATLATDVESLPAAALSSAERAPGPGE